MKLDPVFMTTKTGLRVEFRSASEDEALTEIEYLRRVCGETRFLLSAAEDVNFKEEGERSFLKHYEEDPGALMLNVYVDGQMVGNGSFAVVAHRPRLAHRAEVGIALFQDYCSQGIGELAMRIMIDKARECGYEILELDVYADNTRAVRLYEKLGFSEYGRMKNGVRYEDGTHADIVYMQMEL